MDTENKFRSFLDKHYPISLPLLSSDDINKISREIWYCNISGKIIPELQKYNKSEVFFDFDHDIFCDNQEDTEYDTNNEQEDIDMKLYKNGYNNYSVLKNGMAFIDIFLLAEIFDYFDSLQQDVNHEEIKCEIDRFIVGALDQKLESRKDIYKLINYFHRGTVILRNIIPCAILQYIQHEFSFGEVVDTDGYRGFGLYIKNDHCFEKVDIGEYYPIWDLYFLDRKGYIYYLKYSPETVYDILYFHNDIYFDQHNNVFGSEKIASPSLKADNFDIAKTHNYAKFDANGKFIYHTYGKWIEIHKDENQFYCVPYPFETCNHANFLVMLAKQNNVKFKIKINQEFLIIDQSDIYFLDSHMQNKTYIHTI